MLAEIYDEVSSGNEIRSVVLAGERLKKQPDGQDRRHRDLAGRRQKVRAKRVEDKIPLDPFTAGVYIATMMAQIDILLTRRATPTRRSPTSRSSRRSTR